MFYNKETDGTFTFFHGANSASNYMSQTDFFRCYSEFTGQVSEMWICSKFSGKSDLVGYVVGFNISPKGSDHDIEVVYKGSSGRPRIFKTIDAAFAWLLRNGFDSAVVNFG